MTPTRNISYAPPSAGVREYESDLTILGDDK